MKVMILAVGEQVLAFPPAPFSFGITPAKAGMSLH